MVAARFRAAQGAEPSGCGTHNIAMAQERSPKRARKKERRHARREEWQQYVKQRRRRRWLTVLGSLAVIGIGVVVALFSFTGGDEKPPSASASASPARGQMTVPNKEPVACDA